MSAAYQLTGPIPDGDEYADGWKNLRGYILREARVIRRDGLVYVPYYTAVGDLHNVKVFGHGRSWWLYKDRELIPYGLEQLAAIDDAPNMGLLITEGESDALTLRQWAGYESRPDLDGYDVLGAPGSSTWTPGWCRFAARYRRVYVLGDGDQAGQRFNWLVKTDIPHAVIVDMPGSTDVRGLLQDPDVKIGGLVLAALIRKAERWEQWQQDFWKARDIQELDDLQGGR